MKPYIALILMLVTTACSTAPSKGSPEYIREQVFACRSLCANGEVNITKIEGLDCVCNKPQQPFIYNPMMGGSAGGGGSSSSSSGSSGAGTSGVAAQPSPQLTLSPNAAHAVDATGRNIYSQVKEQ